ncbi:zincin-like metallopeptidase domain-containing protein [Zunongwangia sp.]|uniref:zincin-like metallopeptidase domain-containing protein n=1 Tax=Zunongwangia sp. TaxID=1965325 RepID=UPI003AA8529B
MNVVQAFNNLHGTIATREDLIHIANLATEQEQQVIATKINQLLTTDQSDKFKITISKFAFESIPEEWLLTLDKDIPQEECKGLSKAVSPDDIYQMITDTMISKINKASGESYQTKWKKEGYLIPFSFETKKPYRGINMAMLSDFGNKSFQNPFFLTFNQIEKNKGKLKKGAKGEKVIYFTQLYKYQQAEPELEFGTYSRSKMIAWLKKNRKQIELLKNFSPENITDQNAIPILKYYNVFNGNDIENIDFDLKNFKIGYYNNGIKGNNDSRLEIADAIFKNYPTPSPKLKNESGRAYYNFVDDFISLPAFADFETSLDYYRTLFHEMTHSTGSENRLDRKIKNKFGSKAYAKEELIAEFGAVFLSAQAGIIWRNQNNHAEYIKNWQNALKHLEKDNRLLMRVASAAQKSTDFILNYDNNEIPKFQKELEKTNSNSPKKNKENQQKQLSLFEGLNGAPNFTTAKEARQYLKKIFDNKDVLEQIFPKALKANGRLKKGYMYAKGGEIVKVNDSKKQSVNYNYGLMKPEYSQVEELAVLDDFEPDVVEAQQTIEQSGHTNNTVSTVHEAKVIERQEPTPELPKLPSQNNNKIRNMVDKSERTFEFYNVSGETGKFLQRVEQKPKGSVDITLSAPKGAGKTTLMYQMMNDFAAGKNPSLFVSLEEDPESVLAEDKRVKYIDDANKPYIDEVGEIKSKQELYDLIEQYDIIFIDSWQKLVRKKFNIEFDEGLRKRFDGKVFIVIFQETVDGRVKGGADIEFDGDIITKVHKGETFAENYAWFDKNRYTTVPIHTLRYMIADQKCISEAEEQILMKQIPDNVPEQSNSSSLSNIGIVATAF